MHLGLLRGALDEMGAPAPTSLTPFVQPHLCVARITPAAGPSPTSLPEPVEAPS
jgi:hypothetical protein